MRLRIALLFMLLFAAAPARAEFIITSAIIEFTQDGPRQQDIELVSHSTGSDYIVAEVNEINHPGRADEKRVPVADPAASRILVTPDKTILAGGSRKVLRFVLLKEPDAQEHIYRVAVKPVIKGVETAHKVGLRMLVGYEVLVIIRPAALQPAYTAVRDGASLHIHNTGNTNILFQNGQQCTAAGACQPAPVARVYPGEQSSITLPRNDAVTYPVWDGAATTEKKF